MSVCKNCSIMNKICLYCIVCLEMWFFYNIINTNVLMMLCERLAYEMQ